MSVDDDRIFLLKKGLKIPSLTDLCISLSKEIILKLKFPKNFPNELTNKVIIQN
jgi:hypothetical protein